MDFSYRYTEEQQRFRQEIAKWLNDALPGNPGEVEPTPTVGSEAIQNIRQTLQAKGWLAATDPPELGGAGLTADHNVVLLEELNRVGLLFLLEDEAATLRSAVLRWGDENQNNQLVRPRGEFAVWKQVVAGGEFLDPDGVGFTAVPDGDGYILDGEASFSGPGDRPSRIWTVALIEPEVDEPPVPVSFLIALDLDGVGISTPRTLIPGSVHRVVLDGVWVPRSDLLGGEGDGAAVITGRIRTDPRANLPTLLESETDALLDHARNTESGGEPLAAEPVRQQLLVEAYIASRVMRLLRMRSAWMREKEHKGGHEEAQAALWEERASRQLSDTAREVVGIHSMLDDSDPRSPAGGRFDRLQRRELATRNTDASGNTNAETIANSLGMGSVSPQAERDHHSDEDG